jgi:hypothetical protein
MISLKKKRQVLAVVSTGLLLVVCSSISHAGRSVRSDSGDGAFEFLGGFWGSDTEQFGGPGISVRTEFKLRINPANAAFYWTVCMSEDGFLKLVTTDTCADSDYALPPVKPYIAAFATDLDSLSSGFGSYKWTRGFVDTVAQYRLWQTVPAMRFSWNGVTLAGDTICPFDVQIVLLDRSNGTNNGDFDIEFNYGNGDVVPPDGFGCPVGSDGFRSIRLGPNSRGPTLGPFGPFDTNGAPIRFCFRGGVIGCPI